MTTAEALHARAGRAHEDPYAMTTDAPLGRLPNYVIAIVRKNPDLGDKEVAKAARLLLKADMAERAERSAQVRRERSAANGAGRSL